MKNLLSKFSLLGSKALCAISIAFFTAQSVFAQTTSLEIPAGTGDTLIGYINDAFGVIIGVVVVVIAAGLIIKMLRKAGG